MLVFMRKEGETFYIGEEIEITIANIESKQVKICVSAPKELAIIRKELLQKEFEKKKKKNVFQIAEKLKTQAL